MNETTNKNVQISHINNGEIKREQATQRKTAFVKATLSSATKEHEHNSSMKEDLLRKLKEQREKIEEETKLAVASKDAWVKHLEDAKRSNKEDER